MLAIAMLAIAERFARIAEPRRSGAGAISLHCEPTDTDRHRRAGSGELFSATGKACGRSARGPSARASALRIGLITNQTGVDSQGRRTIDVLAHAPGVKLVALFSPEHGMAGNADVPRVARCDRCGDGAAGVQPVRRDAAAHGGDAEGHRCAGLRHSGCGRALLHLHHDDGLLHGGGGESITSRFLCWTGPIRWAGK